MGEGRPPLNALLDSHAFLWWVEESARLSPRAREFLADGGNVLYWSVASTWEVAIKVGKRKLKLPESTGAFLASQLALQSVRILPVEQRHAVAVADLAPHHKDPFDRLLVAQALVEGLSLVSCDEVLSRYGVERIW